MGNSVPSSPRNEELNQKDEERRKAWSRSEAALARSRGRDKIKDKHLSTALKNTNVVLIIPYTESESSIYSEFIPILSRTANLNGVYLSRVDGLVIDRRWSGNPEPIEAIKECDNLIFAQILWDSSKTDDFFAPEGRFPWIGKYFRDEQFEVPLNFIIGISLTHNFGHGDTLTAKNFKSYCDPRINVKFDTFTLPFTIHNGWLSSTISIHTDYLVEHLLRSMTIL
jgi:hypothetical protein